MKNLFELTVIEFKQTIRTFTIVFFSLVFPSMMLLLFGGINGNEPVDMLNGYGMIDVSVPTYIAMIMAVTGLMSLPLAVSGYREKKILKRFKATPINPAYILLSQFVVNVLMTIAGMILLFILGKVLFDLHFMGKVPVMLAVFLLSLLSVYSIGFVIASFAPSMRFATTIANIVYFPMIFLSGATIPLEVMPHTMITISKAIPLTYAVDLLKGLWLGGSVSSFTTDIVVLSSILVVCTVLSVKTFKWE